MNDRSAGYDELPRSAYLEHTLRRARTAAEQRSHRYVTLDHLLLALLDDPDAIKLLKVIGADIAAIQATIANTVNGRMAALVDPSGRPPSFSYRFDTLFTGVAEDALRAGRMEIDGALAVIAVARDPESHASEILKANGFRLEAALRALGRDAEPQPVTKLTLVSPAPTPTPGAAIPAPAAQGPQLRTPQPSPQLSGQRGAQAPQAADGEILVEDMLATVRNILDGEERKGPPSFTAPPALPPIAPPSQRPPQPRLEPQLRANGSAARNPATGGRPRAHSSRERADPGAGAGALPGRAAAQPALRAQSSQQSAGFAEPPPAAFDLEAPSAPQRAGKKGRSGASKGARASGEPVGPLAKVLEGIPRRARLARGEIFQIRLAKEEAAQLFAGAQRRPAPGGEAFPVCRAVTIRLSAPEGGFFIETGAPETQWIVNRQGAGGGEEAFGTWSWAVVPNETGAYGLSVSISARDFDASGFLSEIRLPEQTVKIRVRRNFSRIFWSLFRLALLLAVGSGLTVAAWYLLKALGKLPH